MTSQTDSPIYQARRAQSMSRAELAAKVGTSQQQIARLENGERKLTVEWARRIADVLQIPVSQALGISTFPSPHVEFGEEIRMAPLIGQVSCGMWQEAVEQPIGYVPSTDGGPRTFALRAEGDSMNLIVPNRGVVGVDPDQLDLLDGRSYIVMNGEGEATAKRFKANPARLVPASTNPNHHEIAIGREGFEVIGRIVWVLHSV